MERHERHDGPDRPGPQHLSDLTAALAMVEADPSAVPPPAANRAAVAVVAEFRERLAMLDVEQLSDEQRVALRGGSWSA